MSFSFGSILFLLAITAISSLSQGEMPPLECKDGRVNALIVLSKDAPPEVRRGAEELSRYLGRVLGCGPAPIILPDNLKDEAGRIAIHVGVHGEIRNKAPDLEACGDEGAWIKALDSSNLLIAGKTPIGTEFGVYGFLQQYCGVRWYLPGELGTYVPSRKSISLGSPDMMDRPAFDSRWIYPGSTLRNPSPASMKMDAEWERHNRLKQNFKQGHNLWRIISPERYAKEHPEYFPMIRGKRRIPGVKDSKGWQPCMTNPDVIRLVAKAASDFFDHNPEERFFPVGVNDGAGFCECNECQAVNGPLRINSQGQKDYSRLMFHFLNQVAEQMPDRYRNRYLSCLAYVWTRDWPEGMTINPAIQVNRPTDFINYYNATERSDLASTRKFAESLPMFGVYDYWYGAGYQIPVFSVGLMENYVEQLWAWGARGFFIEGSPNWGMDGLKYYLLAQKLWDPSLKTHEMIDAFCRNLFGEKAAPSVSRFFRRCQEIWETQTAKPSWFQHWQANTQFVLFNTDRCLELMALLDEAESRTTSHQGLELLSKFKKSLALTLSSSRLLEATTCLGKDHSTQAVFAALQALANQEAAVDELRRDPFTLPRGRGERIIAGLSNHPVSIAGPLLASLAANGDREASEAFLSDISQQLPQYEPVLRWLMKSLPSLQNQPELCPQGKFERATPKAKDALGWRHGDWGGRKVRSKVSICPSEGDEKELSYRLTGIEGTLMYLPSPIIETAPAAPLKVSGGRWYLLRANLKYGPQELGAGRPRFYLKFSESKVASKESIPKSFEQLRLTVTPTPEWREAFFVFQAPAEADRLALTFVSECSIGDAWIKGVSLKEIPAELAPNSEWASPQREVIWPER